MNAGQEHGLKKDLGLISVTALVVGMVIGSGIFMKPGKVISAAGSSDMALLAWLIGGTITLAGGLTIAELSAQFPKTGGLYAYLDEVYGRMWSYLFGWVEAIIYGPATVAALGLYFSYLVVGFFHFPETYKIPIAVVTVMFLAIVSSLGSKYGGMLQTVATAGKLIPIVLIAGFGLFQGDAQVLNMSSGLDQAAGMGTAILATLWAYDGWVAASFISGEVKNPGKQMPRAIILGLCIVMLAYLAVNFAMLHVLPAAQIVELGQNAAGSAAGILFGEIGGKLLSIGIIISIFGTLNGFVLATPRIPFAMALRVQLPCSKSLSKVHSSFGTPINAMLLEIGIAFLLMLVGDADRLTDIAMFIVWVFYMSGFFAVFIMRKRSPQASRPYSVPLYPFIPAVAVAGSLYILGSTVMSNPVDSLYSLAVAALGIPVYIWLTKKQVSVTAGGAE